MTSSVKGRKFTSPRKVQNTFASLAYEVLKHEGKPIHYKSIAEKVLIKKTSKGKTPIETLRVEINRDKRFVKVSRGIYGLKEWHGK